MHRLLSTKLQQKEPGSEAVENKQLPCNHRDVAGKGHSESESTVLEPQPPYFPSKACAVGRLHSGRGLVFDTAWIAG